MSDSQFEDLTSQVYASKIQNQLKTSKFHISKLADQSKSMRMKIQQLTENLQQYKKQIEAKNSILTKISSDEVRLSKKLLILQEQKVHQKQQMLKTQKHYENVINQLIAEKEQLLKINKQLSETLIKIDLPKQQGNQLEKDSLQKRQEQGQNQKVQVSRLNEEIQLLKNRLEKKQKQGLQMKQNFEEKTIEMLKLIEHQEKQKNSIEKEFEASKQKVKQLQIKLIDMNEKIEKCQKEQFEKQTNAQQMNRKLLSQLQQNMKKLQKAQMTVNHLQGQKKTQQMITVQYGKQITALQQKLQKLKQQHSQQQIRQMPIAEILFLVSKFVKINRENSFKMMNECGINQQERVNIEKDILNQLLDKIYSIFPKQLGYGKFGAM